MLPQRSSCRVRCMGRPHSIRIVGGDWRGRRLPIPTGTQVRPTPDRARETLFNWLTVSVVGARCLDLYAGTGALGFEALSRGARETWFIERNSRLQSALRERIDEFGANATVVGEDVGRVLSRSIRETFDLVFLDPPYEDSLEPILAALPPWLAPEARIYVERSSSSDDALKRSIAAVPGLDVIKESRAGGVRYGLLQFAE